MGLVRMWTLGRGFNSTAWNNTVRYEEEEEGQSVIWEA